MHTRLFSRTTPVQIHVHLPLGVSPSRARSSAEELWVDPQLYTFQVLQHSVIQAERYFQVLTKAVGMRE